MLVSIGLLSVHCDSLHQAVALVVKLRRRGHDARISLWRAGILAPRPNR